MHVPEDGSVSFSDGELKVELKKSEAWWDAGIGQSVGLLKAGGRYKVSFKAANTGGAGIIHFQVGEEGKDTPVTVIINGQPNQNEPITVSNIMEKYTVEFVIPRNTDIAKAKVVFCLGELRNASVDDISLREIVGEAAE
jgi:hypothetical protein